MTGLVLALLMAVPQTQTERLEAYMIKQTPRSAAYAKRLSVAIFAEASRFGLDPALMAAVAHNESRFDIRAKGLSGERGIWQLYTPSDYHVWSWMELQQHRYGLPTYPDADWDDLHRTDQVRASKDIEISTYMAAHLMSYHVKRCGKQTPKCYARYNSGTKRVKRGYAWALGVKARAIRKILTQ